MYAVTEMTMQDAAERQLSFLGADAIESRVAVFEIGGNRYALFADIVSYGDSWYVLEFGGNLAAMLGVHLAMQGLIAPEIVDVFMEDILGGRDLYSILVTG